MKKILFLLCVLCTCPSWAREYYTWEKATSLAAGDVVVLAAANNKYEFSEISNKFGSSKSFSESPNAVHPLTVSLINGYYRFENSLSTTKYLAYANNSTELAWGKSSEDLSKWKVTFNEDGSATLQNKEVTNRYLRFRLDSKDFRCYSSNAEESPICFYKRITYSDGKQERLLQFSKTECKVKLGDDFEEPVLSGETQGVTYSSSNSDVAVVDANTGFVEIKGGGVTTITATAEATETLNDGTASYVLTVIDYTTITFDFTKASSLQAMGFVTSGNYDPEVSYIYKDEVKIEGSATDKTIIYLDMDKKSLRLYQNGGRINISVPEQYEIMNISIQGTDVAKDKLKLSLPSTGSKESITWTGTTQNYMVEPNGASVVIHKIDVSYRERKLRPATAQVKIGALGLTTFSSYYAWQLPAGLTAATAQLQDEATLQVVDAYQEQEVLPAQIGVVLYGEPGTYELVQPLDEMPHQNVSANLLKPVLTHQTILAQEGHKVFILANDAEHGLGFYYQGKDGDGSSVSRINGKAYLEVPATEAAMSYKLHLTPTTGIDVLSAQTLENKLGVFDLNGRRIPLTHPLKGFYIVNGKKVLFK
jgi:hypothetical protein